MRLYENAPPEQRRIGEFCLARLDLASSRLARSDLEGAAEQAREVMAVSARRRTDSVTRRLRQLAGRVELPPFGRSPVALGLRDEIRSFTTPPPAAALPVGENGTDQ